MVSYQVRKSPAGYACIVILGCGTYPASVSGDLEVRNVGGGDAWGESVYFNVMKGHRVVYSGQEANWSHVGPGQSVSVTFDSGVEWQGGPYRVVLRPKTADD
jgi:hypothetical protein